MDIAIAHAPRNDNTAHLENYPACGRALRAFSDDYTTESAADFLALVDADHEDYNATPSVDTCWECDTIVRV